MGTTQSNPDTGLSKYELKWHVAKGRPLSYSIKTDKRSGITSDPNRPDDPEYIVRLIGQVIQVSIDTVRIVKQLPAGFGG